MRRYCTLIGEIVKEHRSPGDARLHLDGELDGNGVCDSGCAEHDFGFVTVRHRRVNGKIAVEEVASCGLLPSQHFPTTDQILSYIRFCHADSETPLWSAGLLPVIITEVRTHFGTTRGLEKVLLQEYFDGDQKYMDQNFYAWDAELETSSNHRAMSRGMA